jgi:hypothetical protein
MPFNNGFGIPAPPFDAYYGAFASNTASAILLSLTAIWIAIGFLHYRKTKSPVLLILAMSGFLCDLVEPYLDVMGGCLWPTSPNLTLFTILGRPMSLFSLSAWAAFGASMTCISYLMIRKVIEEKKPTSWLWLTFIVAGIVDVGFEEIMLNVHGLYVYYGNQPLILLTKFPWYYATLNGGGLFLATALAYRYRAQLSSWKALLILLLVPMCEGANYGFTAMPAWIVVNGQYGWLATQAGGLATVLLGFAVMAGIFELVLQRNPLALKANASVREDIVAPVAREAAAAAPDILRTPVRMF